MHPNDVVHWERQVAAFKRGVRRLQMQLVGQREWYWGEELARVKGYLANSEGWLSQAQAARDGETVSGNSARQLGRELDLLLQYIPRY